MSLGTTLISGQPSGEGRSRHACPSCGSELVKRLALIHAGGLSAVDASTTGGGLLGRAGLGIGLAKTKGTQQTALSKAAEPPTKRRGLVWGLLLMLFAAGWMPQQQTVGFGIIALAVGAFLTYRAISYNRSTLPALLAEWERKYMCERCGSVFLLP